MGQGTLFNRCIAVLSLVLAAAFNKRHFVVPPHDITPVRLVVFFELCIKLKILSDAHYDVVWGDARVSLVTALVPFAFTEVEGTHTKGYIDNSTLFCSLVLDLDTSKLCVFISWHQQDSTFGELLEHITRCKSILA